MIFCVAPGIAKNVSFEMIECEHPESCNALTGTDCLLLVSDRLIIMCANLASSEDVKLMEMFCLDSGVGGLLSKSNSEKSSSSHIASSSSIV